MRVIDPRRALIVEDGSARAFEDRGGAGTAMRCAVLLLLRNDIPHRGPLLEDPSGRLARDGLFCAGGASLRRQSGFDRQYYGRNHQTAASGKAPHQAAGNGKLAATWF